MPFSWGADGSFTFPTRLNDGDIEVPDDERMTPAQRNDVLTVYAAHDPTRPYFDQVASLQRLRDVRALILNALTGVGLDAVATGDTTTLTGVIAARQGLKDATKDAAILAATTDASFDQAAKMLYARLVAAAPVTVRAAFKDVQ